MDVTEQELQALYSWVDEIPLSRPKRNIARDFSDGVLLAEIVSHYYPKLVELHNYSRLTVLSISSSANATQQKMYNWNTLNQKVFKRLGLQVSRQDCEDVSNCKAGAVERVLKALKVKLAKYKEPADQASSDSGSVDMNVSIQAQPRAAYGDSVPHKKPPQLIQAPIASTGVSSEVLAEKDRTIHDLRETSEILEAKVRKLEQLVRLKDAKIQTLMAKLQAAGLA